MARKLLIFIISIAVIGGIALGVTGSVARAGVWDDVLNFLRGVQNQPVQKDIKTPSVSLYKPVIEYEQTVVQAVESASPSVVSIVISKDLPVIENCPYSPFSDLPPEFRDFFGGGFEFSRPCEKGIEHKEVGGGTGFIVSEDGLILTNKHVVSDTKAEYTVLTNDGKKYTAKVLARDPAQDLAVIKIIASGLKPATLGDSDSIKLGQTAIAIGNSLGEFRNTVSVGVVSGLARNITASGVGFGTETIEGVIQTDAAINPGNSGGPLLNLRGEVIAINTAIASGAQNIGFAIPINQARRDIESVKRTGVIKVAYLGVRYFMLDENSAKKQKLTVRYGALIRGTEDGPGVIPNSPAAKAGLQAEDTILEVNGVPLRDGKILSSVLQKYSIGDTVTLTVRRVDTQLLFKVRLEERPEL